MKNLLAIITVILVVICFQMAQPHFPKRYSAQGLLVENPAKGSTPANPAWFLTACIFALLALITLIASLVNGIKLGHTTHLGWWVELGAIICVEIILAMIFFVQAAHAWAWDARGLEWRGAFRARLIPWAQISRLGKSWNGDGFAGMDKGPRIRWSRIKTQKPAAILMALEHARPDLSQAIKERLK